MMFLRRWRIWALFLMTLGAVPVRAATPTITLTAVSSASQITVTNPVTYTFSLTNNYFSSFSLVNVLVTNTFSLPIQYGGASTNQGGLSYGTTTNAIAFEFGDLQFPTNIINFYLTVYPQVTGTLTNTVTVYLAGTNAFTTNLLVSVSGAAADLSVTNLGFQPAAYVAPAYVNDRVTCGVIVSNAGPGSVGNAILTNSLPAGMELIGISPVISYTIVNSNALFSLGTLNSGSSQTFYLTFQPTNSGVYAFTNSIGAPALNDPNAGNNRSVDYLSVSNYLSTNLVAYTNSGIVFNPQDALMEQSIVVSNAGSLAVPAVRLVVTGLSTNWLFNGADTNLAYTTNGSPFVVSPAPLNSHQTLPLVLEYVVTNRSSFPFTNGQLHAYGVALPNLAPPAAIGISTNENSQIFLLKSGVNQNRILLEFNSQVGSNYTVVYANNIYFTNAQTVQPALKAQANITQWIDYGPPGTASVLTNSNRRFYRVLRNP